MKYISLIDELSITIESLQTIDAKRIEQIQKQLEFEAILDSNIKITELSPLIAQLNNQEFRDATIFIEKYVWLKKILLNQPQHIALDDFKTIDSTQEITSYTNSYISSFLLQALTPTLSYFFSEEKFLLLRNFVSQNHCFSDQVKQKIIFFFSNTLLGAQNYIAQGKIKESRQPLLFLSNPDFIQSINLYIENIINEVTTINSGIIRVYNLNQSARNLEWEFATSVMIAFGKLSLPNQHQQEVFTKNAVMAKSDKFKSDFKDINISKSNSKDTKTTYIIISIVAFIFIIVGISIPFIKKNTSTDFYYENTDDTSFEEIIEEYNESQNNSNIEENDVIKTGISSTRTTNENTPEIEETERVIIPEYTTLPNRLKSHNQDSHIRFLYSLKNKVTKGDDNEAKKIIRITPYTNPYPKTFNPIQTGNDIASQLGITNSTEKELIIFKLQDGIDEATIIPKNNKATLDFKEGDSIIFYAGNDFTASRFSHFTREQDVSNIYEITSLSNSSTIEVLPFKDNSGSAKNTKFHRSIESLQFHNIETKKLKSIESLYSDYYKAYYKR